MKKLLNIGARRATVFTFDLLAIGLAFTGAFLLRFDFKIPSEFEVLMWNALPLIFLVQSIVFVTQGLYRGLWSFASLRDLALILRAVVIAEALTVTLVFFAWHRLIGWPRSIFILDSFLLILILGGGRFTYRFGREAFLPLRGKNRKTLIIGAAQSGNVIAREFNSRPDLKVKVVGFLDDRASLIGSRLQGAPVLGPVDSLERWLAKFQIQEIIIAVPGMPGSKIRQIVATARNHNIPTRISPPIHDVLVGKVELNQLREVRVEDLLRRDVVTVDETALNHFFSGKRVLVSGAGGSIGSELCRQILKYGPASLILFERSEYNLYRFERELASMPELKGDAELLFVIGDVLDSKRLQNVFEEHRPEIVLHAAAYKHVPLMEENIYEAVRNNVIGTYQLASMAAASGTANFVLISTDKAVRPTSVMGATKRMAELVTNVVRNSGKMKVAAVRFGNVLDSEGSVLPLFRDQIANGGPVTVTHPDVTRYFMTIPEASQLVLQASLLGQGGEVFLLDMGEPVLIRQLAEELIQLSGLKPYEDIDIVFTGLRKGEKLYEELLIDMNHVRRTSHPKIMVSTSEYDGHRLSDHWRERLEGFITSGRRLSDEDLLEWIQEWVPEYGTLSTSELQAEIASEKSSRVLH